MALGPRAPHLDGSPPLAPAPAMSPTTRCSRFEPAPPWPAGANTPPSPSSRAGPLDHMQHAQSRMFCLLRPEQHARGFRQGTRVHEIGVVRCGEGPHHHSQSKGRVAAMAQGCLRPDLGKNCWPAKIKRTGASAGPFPATWGPGAGTGAAGSAGRWGLGSKRGKAVCCDTRQPRQEDQCSMAWHTTATWQAGLRGAGGLHHASGGSKDGGERAATGIVVHGP